MLDSNGRGPVSIQPQPLSVDIDPDPPFAISPFVRPGDLAYVIGEDGVGKTTFIADLLLAATLPLSESDGKCAGGAFEVDRVEFFTPESKALIIDAENPPEYWSTIILRALASLGKSKFARWVMKRIHFIDGDETGLGVQGHRQAAAENVINYCGDNGYRLVVMDPIWSVFKPVENADSSWVTDGLRPLAKGARERGIVLLAVAHPNANAANPQTPLAQKFSPFGSSQQKGAMDCRFGLARHRVKNPKTDRYETGFGVVLHYLKDRRTYWIKRNTHIVLPFSSHGAGYGDARGLEAWPASAPDIGTPLLPVEVEILLEFPEDCTGVTVSHFTRRPNTVRDAINKALIPQELVEVAGGTGKRGDPMHYRLTGKGVTTWQKARELEKTS